MTYRVEFRPRAEQDLETLFRYLIQEAPLSGRLWINGLEAAIYSLRELPERCPIARPFSRQGVEVRLLLYGRRPHAYRIFFRVEGSTVAILHIRHGARLGPKRRDLLD